MIVCVCYRVSDRDIAHAVRDGVQSFDQLQDETCVARGCGCCHECAVETFERAVGVHAAGDAAAFTTPMRPTIRLAVSA